MPKVPADGGITSKNETFGDIMFTYTYIKASEVEDLFAYAHRSLEDIQPA